MRVNANTAVYDKTLDRAAMAQLHERRINNKVSGALDKHIKRVNTLVESADLSKAGVSKLMKALDKEINTSFSDINRTTKASLITFTKDQISWAYQNMETHVGKIWKTERPNRMVAEDIILKRPLIADRTLLEGWSGISLGERMRINQTIRRGIAEGKSVNDIALLVRKGNVHNITRNQSKALVVTAMTSVHAQADQVVYEANSKAIIGWQYVAVLDSATTEICRSKDGNIYKPDDYINLPPSHYNCRSTTTPVFKSWEDMAKLEGVSQIRRRNLSRLSDKDKAFYDGMTPLRESYEEWLRRQPPAVQLRHLGDYKKLELFREGQISLRQFTTDKGASIGIRDLRAMTSPAVSGDTRKFAMSKEKLDAMRLYATNPDDLLTDATLRRTLKDYYLLQASEIDGTLSYTNYRGTLLHNKRASRMRVLSSPPTEAQLKFNPVTGRYEDVRMYQPNHYVLNNSLRLVDESKDLLDQDKAFITAFEKDLSEQMSVNQRAVIVDNLRSIFARYRRNPEPWINFKGVVQGQLKFDIMNISDEIETQIRKDSNVLKKLLQDNYVDPVLGTIELDKLHDNFINNIFAKIKWEDTMAPQIANELRGMPTLLGRFQDLVTPKAYKEIRGSIDATILKNNPILWKRLDESSLQQFYLRFAHRLSLADTPDRDSFAVALGRDLYNLGGLNGNRRSWYRLGMDIVEDERTKKFFEVETFGVQKRRLKSKMSGQYFGQYYDTLSYNIRVTDPRIQEYSRLTRKVDLGLRVSVTSPENRLLIREGYKTYFVKRNGLYNDTRIPITSTSSFSDFPVEFVDKNLADALNWTSQAQYKIDPEFYDFTKKLLYFEDDRGKAAFYNSLNEYREFMIARGDMYERFSAMEWLRNSGKGFSNHAFIDHRARVYERGLIGPQSGETFS